VERVEAHGVRRVLRREGERRNERRGRARIAEERAIEEAREVPARERIGHRRHAEAERRRPRRVARERPSAAHGEDVQAIAGVREHLRLAPGEERREHLACAARNERAAGTRRVALPDVEPRELPQSRARILAACGGEAPCADGGTDQVTHARRRRQPLGEDRAVERGDAESLRAARGAGDHLDLGRVEARRADAREGACAGAQGENSLGLQESDRLELPGPQ
jgi:hypothetical protein